MYTLFMSIEIITSSETFFPLAFGNITTPGLLMLELMLPVIKVLVVRGACKHLLHTYHLICISK